MLYVVGRISEDFKNYLETNAIRYGQFISSRHPITQSNQYAVNFTSVKSITDSLSELILPELPSAIVTSGFEQYVVPAAYVARHFNLPGNTIGSAKAATDKAIMRQKFMQHCPALTPRFRHVETLAEAIDFADQHGYPVMLKPTNLMKSLLVTKCQSRAELEAAFQAALARMPQLDSRYSIMDRSRLIIEDYVSGSLHTVAGIVAADGTPHLSSVIADCLTAQDIGYNDSYLFSRSLPSRLLIDQQKMLLEAAEKGIRALGLAACPVHVELMLTADGPKIIEIGARQGGYRPAMYAKSCQTDLYRAMIQAAAAEAFDLGGTFKANTAVIELFPDKVGTFETFTHQITIEALTSFEKLTIKTATGKQVGPARDGYKCPVIIFLKHADNNQLQMDIAKIQQLVSIQVAIGRVGLEDTPNK